MKKPVKSSKMDNSRLEKAAKIAEESGNKKAAKKIRNIIKQRNNRFQQREAAWKAEQSHPQYNPRGPN